MIKAEELTQEKYYRNLIVFYVHEENPRIRVGYFSDPKTERVFIDAKTKEEFKTQLGKVMDLSKDSLEIKREVVETNLKKGLVPFAHAYLGTYDNHFSTIGINGMHEALLNLLGQPPGRHRQPPS